VVKKRTKPFDDQELLVTLMRCAEDKKAVDPIRMDLREVDGPASFFFVCSGESSPQLRAIADAIQEGVSEDHGLKPVGRDGNRESGWMILDYGSVLVHILSAEKRARYSLEELWKDGVRKSS
jgi:ribosome-associated protein